MSAGVWSVDFEYATSVTAMARHLEDSGVSRATKSVYVSAVSRLLLDVKSPLTVEKLARYVEVRNYSPSTLMVLLTAVRHWLRGNDLLVDLEAFDVVTWSRPTLKGIAG